MAAAAWNKQNFLLHVPFIYVQYFLIAFSLTYTPDHISIGVKFSPGYTCLNFSSCGNSEEEQTD